MDTEPNPTQGLLLNEVIFMRTKYAFLTEF